MLKKLIYVGLVFISIFGKAQSDFNQDYKKDGPYVLHYQDKIYVTHFDEKGEPITQIYNKNEPIILQVADPTSDKVFSFPLNKSHQKQDSNYHLPEKIFFTSDIEGQFKAFKKMLIDGGVMDEDFNWIYGKGHLYCNGDMVDRGEFVTETLWLIYKLEQEAEKAGGKVHYVLGNHEFMMLDSDTRYVNEKYRGNKNHISHLRKIKINSYADFFQDYSEFGKWFKTKNIIEKIGDFTITHAGVSPEVASLNLPYDTLNHYGRIRMENPYFTMFGKASIVTGGSDTGLFWYRGIGYAVSEKEENRAKSISQNQVDEIMKNIHSQKMIIGHTITAENAITTFYNGKVIDIDLDHPENIEEGKVENLVFEKKKFKRFISDKSGKRYLDLFEMKNKKD